MKTSTISAPFTSEESTSLLDRVSALFSTIGERVRKAAEERRIRAELAELDDAMLADIGIAPDEIARIRAQERFTPRGWADRALQTGAFHE